MKLNPRIPILACFAVVCTAAQAQTIPGDARSAGLAYIVPDTACWFDTTAGGYVTNGFINLETAATSADLGNWEPYTSVVGDHTFLIEFNTYANDGTLLNQNNAIVKQPATGGASKAAYAFYGDNGVPFKGMINLSRQNGNPGRVAGDKRIGATNFITECEVSIGQVPAFQTDGRWANNNIYSGVNRYPAEQVFGLDPSSLAQTPLTRARDFVYGSYVGAMGAANNAPQCGRTGGRPEFLDNGNIVVMIDDKTAISSTAGEVTTFSIIKPDGTLVKGPTLAVARDIWDNMSAFQGGFCIRAGADILFYRNDGSLIKSNNLVQATANLQAPAPNGWEFTGSWDLGRGDAVRMGGDIRSPYVYIAGGVAMSADSNACMMAVWNGQSGAFITNVMVSTDIDPSVATIGRAALAVDKYNRICVAFSGTHDKFAGYQPQIIARVVQFDGSKISYLCPSFYAFQNSDNGNTTAFNGGPLGFTSLSPSVAMTDKAICIAGKGLINSTNNPYSPSFPDSPLGNTTVYTVITTPLGGPESAGLTYVVPDMICWWNSVRNQITNGPVNLAQQGAVNLGNWEPYTSVLGDSTFLIEFSTYANDSTLLNQNNVIAKQPAAGGAPVIDYAFYDDSGLPFKGQINLSRQNGNPGRVAGDMRYGATRFITECEVSIGQLPQFQANNRWNANNIYQGINRYPAEQIFNLDPSTLRQTPVTNAWDYVYGPYSGSMGAANNAPQCGRTGGRANFLDNGNIVVMIDDKTAISSAAGEVTTFAIIDPNGRVVKGPTLVDARDIWENMAAFSGGFAIRTHEFLYFFDNTGKPLHTNNVVTESGISWDTGRGDATRLGSDIRSHYVYLAGQVAKSDYVGIWDARTFRFVTSSKVCELDPAYSTADRTVVAVDAQDRFTVAYLLKPTANFLQNQVAGRVGQFNGSTVTWLTPTFFPFVNHDAYGGTTTIPYKTEGAMVSMTTRQICFAAKGTLNSTNNASAEPDTMPETTVYTVISHPAPLASPAVTMSAIRSGSNLVISWNANAGLFTLVSSTSVASPLSSWSAVSPQPAVTGPVNGQYSMTVPIGAGAKCFNLKR